MTLAAGRYEFAPPPTPGFLRALVLAILAHSLLVAMLTVGVQWKHTSTPVTVEAELWSAVPQQAAPPEPEPVLTPPKPVAPPPPVKPVEPPAPPKPAPEPVKTPDADIAIAKEKLRLQKEKEQELLKREQLKLEREKLAKLQQEKLLQEKLQKEKLEREKEKLDKAARDRQLEDQRAKDVKAAEAVKQKNAAKSKEEAQLLEAERQKTIKRMLSMAGSIGGNGDASSKGTAAQSAGPSAGYAGRIRARIKPNITYTETIVGNPTAEVEVRTSPDGTIISRKLTQSSGVKSWDDAVLNAIDKTEVLPRDVDGRVPSPLIISFRPKD